MKELTYKQELWLRQHGDRTASDVYFDKDRLYIEMWSGRNKKYVKKYIPHDTKLKLYVRRFIDFIY